MPSGREKVKLEALSQLHHSVSATDQRPVQTLERPTQREQKANTKTGWCLQGRPAANKTEEAVAAEQNGEGRLWPGKES